MRDQAIALLKELTEAHSVPGHEDEVRAIFVDELEDCGELSSDRNGSVVCESGEGPRVLVTAHMDEVGFLVHSITADGFVQFVTVGGWWEHTLLSQRVEILTRSGAKVLGVIGSRPPHFLPEAQRRQLMSCDQMFIDVGATSRREVEEGLGIAPGDPVAPWSAFTPLAGGRRFMAKAFDNRVGMAAVIQTGKLLAKTGAPPNRLILAGTVQEEVGLRGARTTAVRTQPEVAIVLEGPPADDTPGFAVADAQGRLGGGVQIRMYDPTAIMNPRLAHFAIDVARAEGIPHQVAVRRTGGTDAGAIHTANDGVPCVVLGVPARYIHAHNAVIDIDDYLYLLALTVAMLRRLDRETVDSFARYL